MKKLTRSALKSLVTYDPATGVFTRKADDLILKPSRQVWLKGRRYSASALAWLWVKRRLPKNLVVHVNKDRLDFRWSNLAAANFSQVNQTRKSWSRFGRGVAFSNDGRAKPWRAYIWHRGKNRELGSYATRDEAAAVAQMAYEKRRRSRVMDGALLA